MSQVIVPFNVLTEKFEVKMDSETLDKNLKFEIEDTLEAISSKVKNSQKYSDYASICSIISSIVTCVILFGI